MRRGIRILVYHGVVERRQDERVEHSFHLLEEFRAHLALLRRRCALVSLADLDRALGERTIRPRVAVTFDDGFANNLLAAELLHEHRIPATVFIASENVSQRRTIWPTLLRLVLARGSVRRLVIEDTTYALDDDPRAFASVRERFKNLGAKDRVTMWNAIVEQLGAGELEDLIAQFPSIEMMSWDDVRTLQSSGITIGSHGRLHELQHAAQPLATREDELAGSRAQIEGATKQRCELFAYPNGSFHPGSPHEVRRAGYQRAFTMVPGTAQITDDPMLVPRLGAPAPLEKFILAVLFGS